MKATNDTNFCRVFELPTTFPQGFCFGGGRPVMLLMVDWFQPCDPRNMEEPWTEVAPKLVAFIRQKRYCLPERQYLVITDFGESLIVKAPEVEG